MTKTGLTEGMLRIHEGLKSGLDIENLINEIGDKPYRSEVEEDPIGQAKRQEEFRN